MEKAKVGELMSDRTLRALAALAAVMVLGAACATPGTAISEEDRCTRFGGMWRAGPGLCTHLGGGGSM